MGLKDELTDRVRKIFQEQWTVRDGQKVPESEDLKLSNDAVKLEGTVLYADLSESTELVDKYKPHFAAEIYKSYLLCAAKLITNEGGVITAYDGDRVMGVFIGDSKNSNAARCALRINYAVRDIITPLMKKQYGSTSFCLRQVVGVDTSNLFVARTGIRGSNDLVWVGRAANYAAKLCSLSPEYPSRITADVYNKLDEKSRLGSDGRPIWERVYWNAMGGISIYRSTWYWPF